MDNEKTFTTTDIAVLFATAESSADELGYFFPSAIRDVHVLRYVRNSLLPDSL